MVTSTLPDAGRLKRPLCDRTNRGQWEEKKIKFSGMSRENHMGIVLNLLHVFAKWAYLFGDLLVFRFFLYDDEVTAAGVVTSTEADEEPSVYSASSFCADDDDDGRLLRNRFLKVFDETAGRLELRTRFCLAEFP